jgi:hypothetical protein
MRSRCDEMREAPNTRRRAVTWAFVGTAVITACAVPVFAQPRATARETPPPVPTVTTANGTEVHVESNPYGAVAEPNPYTAEPAPTEPPAPENPYSQPDPDSPEAEADGARERVKFHSVGIGFHATTFSTERGEGYTLLGPSVVYDYFVGRRFGFALRGEAYFPMSGRMAGNGEDFRTNLMDAYGARRFGFDGMFMVAYRAEVGSSLVMTAAAGLHVQSFRLTDQRFNPIEAITGGFGLLGRVEYRLGSLLSIGGELAIGLDPIDFVAHSNPATFTVPITPSFFVGLTY